MLAEQVLLSRNLSSSSSCLGPALWHAGQRPKKNLSGMSAAPTSCWPPLSSLTVTPPPRARLARHADTQSLPDITAAGITVSRYLQGTPDIYPDIYQDIYTSYLQSIYTYCGGPPLPLLTVTSYLHVQCPLYLCSVSPPGPRTINNTWPRASAICL